MKEPSRVDYAYAVGWVRALEKDLVPQAVFRESAESGDFSPAMKMIFEAGRFREDMIKISDSAGLDEFLDMEAAALYDLLSKITLEKRILKAFIEDNRPSKALALAGDTGYDFIKNYFRHKVDLGNIKIFLRLKYAGRPQSSFAARCLGGGFLDTKLFLETYDFSLSETGARLQFSPYGMLWEKAVDALEDKESFVELERGIEDFLMNYLRRARYVVFGPEPVFAYGLARKRELGLVRLVGTGLLNKVPAELLKERVSETYV